MEQANADRSDDLKRIGRERRQWDVDRQALVEKCGGLSAMVSLREKQDESKKRQHKLAMDKANEVCRKLKWELKDILQQEGRLTYERKKIARDIGLEKQSVTLAMTRRVKSDQKKVDKMDDKLKQRADNLSRQAGSIQLDRAKVTTAKKVVVCTFCFSACLLISFLSSGLSLLKTLQTRQAKAVASRKVFNAERKQTIANFKRQSVELNKLKTTISKVIKPKPVS